MSIHLENIYTGLSGLVLPGPKATYPPAFQGKSRLEYYAHLFSSIEINSSFYKTPQPATVAKWGASVPNDFKFTFKLSKAITHVKGLDFDEAALEIFMESITQVGDKKGCLLIQFPPSLHIEKLDKMQRLLSSIAWLNEQQWQLAVEFRHSSWYEKEVTEILKEHQAITALQDKPAAATPAEWEQSDTIYVRMHGPKGNYKGSYDLELLQQLANNIKAWKQAGKTIYCYFNNTMGNALQNLQTLNEFLICM